MAEQESFRAFRRAWHVIERGLAFLATGLEGRGFSPALTRPPWSFLCPVPRGRRGDRPHAARSGGVLGILARGGEQLGRELG